MADGTFGQPGDALTVNLNRVDLASVDALLLRPPQFTGQLNAAATITGSQANPQVKAEFAVTSGAFRQFTYDSLEGTLDYSGTGITLDTRLQQNPTQWLSAKGYLPVALFSSSSPAGADERVDLTIDSSPLDLGLVQGFTTLLTDVQGTMEAHVRVTGTASDPQPDGTVAIANGALTVAPLGVSYAHIAGTVELKPDRIHIPLITILDNHNSALTFTGDLAMQRRQVGGFEVWINAEDFKVLDNAMGNVRIQSAIQVVGNLRAPIIRGDLGVTTGEINLDEIIAQTTTSAYATEQTQYLDVAGAKPAAEEPPPPSAFDALRLDLRLTVPNDLVVKASDLQAPGAAVSLGCAERHPRRRSDGDEGTGRIAAAARDRQHRARQLRFPGPPLRDPARRDDPLRGAGRDRPESGHADPARDSGSGGARQHPRHAAASRDRAEQHTAARTGRHPLADRLQPAAQPAW